MVKEEEIGVLTVGVSGRRRRGGEEDLVEALVGDVLVDEELVVGAVGAVADEVDDVAVLDAGEEGGLVAELAGALAGPGAEALDGDLPAVGEAAAVDGAEPALPELLPLGEPRVAALRASYRNARCSLAAIASRSASSSSRRRRSAPHRGGRTTTS